jgi:hypothetical protein
VFPWNQRFARILPTDSPFSAREVITGKDARTLARTQLAMTQAEFSHAFKDSPMQRLARRASGPVSNDDMGSARST